MHADQARHRPDALDRPSYLPQFSVRQVYEIEARTEARAAIQADAVIHRLARGIGRVQSRLSRSLNADAAYELAHAQLELGEILASRIVELDPSLASFAPSSATTLTAPRATTFRRRGAVLVRSREAGRRSQGLRTRGSRRCTVSAAAGDDPDPEPSSQRHVAPPAPKPPTARGIGFLLSVVGGLVRLRGGRA